MEGHFYTLFSADRSKDFSIETDFLSRLEHNTSPIIQNIINCARKGIIPPLTTEQLKIWNQFFLTQWRRTPDTQQSVVSDGEALAMLSVMIDDARKLVPHLNGELDTLSTDREKQRIVRNARTETLVRDSDAILKLLEQRGLTVLRISRPNKAFVIGSRPVVKMTTGERRELNDPVVEMWLPISSDVAVGVGQGKAPISLLFLSDDRPIRQLNRAIAEQSRTVAGRSPALVQSVAHPR